MNEYTVLETREYSVYAESPQLAERAVREFPHEPIGASVDLLDSTVAVTEEIEGES